MILLFIAFFGYQNIQSQTILDNRLLRIKKLVAFQNSRILKHKINVFEFKKLEKNGYNLSLIDFNKLDHKKIIILFYRYKRQKTALFASGIVFNTIGTALSV